MARAAGSLTDAAANGARGYFSGAQVMLSGFTGMPLRRADEVILRTAASSVPQSLLVETPLGYTPEQQTLCTTFFTQPL
jgi:hypothetical protein